MPCVYFIRKGHENIFKVGKGAGSGYDRLASLQTGNEAKLSLCAVIHCSTSQDAYTTEHYIHSQFGAYRLQGEWFVMSWNDVNAVLRYYKNRQYDVEIFNEGVQDTKRFSPSGTIDVAEFQRMLKRIKQLEKGIENSIELRDAREQIAAQAKEIDRLRGIINHTQNARPVEPKEPVPPLTFANVRPARYGEERIATIDVDTEEPPKKRKLFGIF